MNSKVQFERILCRTRNKDFDSTCYETAFSDGFRFSVLSEHHFGMEDFGKEDIRNAETIQKNLKRTPFISGVEIYSNGQPFFVGCDNKASLGLVSFDVKEDIVLVGRSKVTIACGMTYCILGCMRLGNSLNSLVDEMIISKETKEEMRSLCKQAFKKMSFPALFCSGANPTPKELESVQQDAQEQISGFDRCNFNIFIRTLRGIKDLIHCTFGNENDYEPSQTIELGFFQGNKKKDKSNRMELLREFVLEELNNEETFGDAVTAVSLEKENGIHVFLQENSCTVFPADENDSIMSNEKRKGIEELQIPESREFLLNLCKERFQYVEDELKGVPVLSREFDEDREELQEYVKNSCEFVHQQTDVIFAKARKRLELFGEECKKLKKEAADFNNDARTEVNSVRELMEQEKTLRMELKRKERRLIFSIGIALMIFFYLLA